MLFLIPIATVLALSVIYFNELGWKIVLIYLLALVLLFLSPLAGISGYLAGALQALLAAGMYIHARSKTF